MLEILPYAKYNVLQFARTQGVSPRDLFVSGELTDRRVALLNREQRAANQLSAEGFAGECFAKKRQVHGLFSDSEICLWTASELNPLILGYTVGHELVHFHQIRVMMERERVMVVAIVMRRRVHVGIERPRVETRQRRNQRDRAHGTRRRDGDDLHQCPDSTGRRPRSPCQKSNNRVYFTTNDRLSVSSAVNLDVSWRSL